MKVVCCIIILCTFTVGFFFPASGGGVTNDKPVWLFEIRGVTKNHSFNRPQGMFLDSFQKKVYIADTDNREIAVFSFSGDPSSSRGADEAATSIDPQSLGRMVADAAIFQTERPLFCPIGIAADSKGKIYISFREKESLDVFDAKGKFLYPVPSPEFLKEHTFSAGKFVLSPEGNLYVINRKTDEIYAFEQNGSFAFRFGGKGSGNGKFQLITDIFFQGDKLYLTDAQGIPVQVFTSLGKYLYSFGKHGQSAEDFSFPQAISVDRYQRIWVADAFRHRVRVYNQKGNFLFGFGSYGMEAGKFCFPVDLDFDGQDRIYILEKSGNRFQVFQIEGNKAQGEKEENSRRKIQGEKKKM